MRRVQRARQYVWVDIDPLGLSDELDLRLHSRRLRVASPEAVAMAVHEVLPIEPAEPLWEPMCDALRSPEEQDSDVYFVLKGGPAAEHPEEVVEAGGGGESAVTAAEAAEAEEELGTAHINLEDLLRREHEPSHEKLEVLDEAGKRIAWCASAPHPPLASPLLTLPWPPLLTLPWPLLIVLPWPHRLTVSVKALAAVRYAQARLGSRGERLGMHVSVLELRLESAAVKRLGELLSRRALKVAVDLPGGVSTSSLVTKPLRLDVQDSKKPLAFGYDAAIDIVPGSASHTALLTALEAAEGDHPDADHIDAEAEVLLPLVADCMRIAP